MLLKLSTTILFSLSLLNPLILGAPITSSQALAKRATTATYTPGQLSVTAANTALLTLDNGVYFALIITQSDFAAIQGNTVLWQDKVNYTPGCSAHACKLVFQGDGNLVSSIDGRAVWNTQTLGKGAQLVFNYVMPYIQILNAAGQVVWTTPLPPKDPNPKPCRTFVPE